MGKYLRVQKEGVMIRCGNMWRGEVFRKDVEKTGWTDKNGEAVQMTREKWKPQWMMMIVR